MFSLQNPEPLKTSLQYFDQYFSDDFFREAAEFSNQYSIWKLGKILHTDVQELKKFFAVNLVMGCVPFPRLRMYWSNDHRYTLVCDNISRDRFFSLRNCFHVVDVSQPPENRNDNKLWKVQPVINAVRNACLQLPRDHVTYSIDEQMIPFTGRCPMKQYVKNKPRPVGLKKFILATSSGLMLDFEIYQGDSTPLGNRDLGLGASVVLRLVKSLLYESFVFFDRYFCSLPLLDKLSELKINATGTILTNRVRELKFSDASKMNRGDSVQYVSDDKKISVVEWKDNNRVVVASNCLGDVPVGIANAGREVKKSTLK